MARSNLTPREHEALQLVAKGLTNKQIGLAFGISDNTARNHVNSIIEKLEFRIGLKLQQSPCARVLFH